MVEKDYGTRETPKAQPQSAQAGRAPAEQTSPTPAAKQLQGQPPSTQTIPSIENLLTLILDELKKLVLRQSSRPLPRDAQKALTESEGIYARLALNPPP